MKTLGYEQLGLAVALFVGFFGASIQGNLIQSPRTTNWGSWGPRETCRPGQLVNGFQLKVEKFQGPQNYNDDTGLNGIRFSCTDYRGDRGNPLTSRTISSKIGQWGEWGPWLQCPGNQVAVGFELKSERSLTIFDANQDDTAANNLRLICEGGWILEGAGHDWGSWTGPQRCPPNTYICGIQTQVEDPQGRGRDDTALNNVDAVCCQKTQLVETVTQTSINPKEKPPQIVLYEDINHAGTQLTIQPSPGTCVTLNSDWRNRGSSANTRDTCMRIWENAGCTGFYRQLEPGTDCHWDFSQCDFLPSGTNNPLNDNVEAVSDCNYKPAKEPKTIPSFFDQPPVCRDQLRSSMRAALKIRPESTRINFSSDNGLRPDVGAIENQFVALSCESLYAAYASESYAREAGQVANTPITRLLYRQYDNGRIIPLAIEAQMHRGNAVCSRRSFTGHFWAQQMTFMDALLPPICTRNDGGFCDERGHLVASQFCGPITMYNMAPQTERINRGVDDRGNMDSWWRLEKFIAQYIQNQRCGIVEWAVVLHYDFNVERRPKGFKVCASFPTLGKEFSEYYENI